jgi:hypothetical protein
VRVEYRTPEGREVKRTVMVMKGRVSVELE